MSSRPTSESIGARQQTPETERDNVTVHHVVILRGAITPRVRLISQHLQPFSPLSPIFLFIASFTYDNHASFSFRLGRHA